LIDDVRGFYSQFSGEVIVGLEASGYSEWFETMLSELGHQVWVGNATEIRRRARSRQKTDRRDAKLLLDLREDVRRELSLRDAGGEVRHPRRGSRRVRRLRSGCRLGWRSYGGQCRCSSWPVLTPSRG
jgi:transposase